MTQQETHEEQDLKLCLTTKFMVQHAYVLKPTKKDNPEDKNKYRMRLVFEKTPGVPFSQDPRFASMQVAAKAAKEEKFGIGFKGGLYSPFKDGDTYVLQKGPNQGKLAKEVAPELAGCIFVDASTTEYPVVVRDMKMGKGPDNKYLEIKDPSQFYNGCYAICYLKAGAFDKNGSKGITMYLGDILKVGDGQRIASASRANMDFPEADVSQYSMDDAEMFGGANGAAQDDMGV